jgi:hypothetical protein
MKLALRIVLGVVTAPLWIAGGAVVLVICSPYFIIGGLISLIQFAFTGEWEFYE